MADEICDEKFTREHGRLTFIELTLTERTKEKCAGKELNQETIETITVGPWKRDYVCSTRKNPPTTDNCTRFPQPYEWTIKQTRNDNGKVVDVKEKIDGALHGISPFGVYDPRLFGTMIEPHPELLLDLCYEQSCGVEARIGIWTLKNLDNIARLLNKGSDKVTNEDLKMLDLRMGIYGAKEALASPYNAVFVSPTTVMRLCNDPLLFTVRDYLELMKINLNVLVGKDLENGNWNNLMIFRQSDRTIEIALERIIINLSIGKTHLEGFASAAIELGYEETAKYASDLVTEYNSAIENLA